MISGSDIVAAVEKFAGDSYVYGAAGPSSFDCSGLVQYTLQKLGVNNVPRTSEAQWAWSNHVDKSQLQPGDLVFAQFPGDNASPGHVGVYTGNGQVLSAEDPESGVGYSSLDSWGSAIVGYGRVPNSATLDSSPGTGGGGGSGLLSIPAQVTSFFGDADTFTTSLMWLVNPGSWVRIGSFIIGVALLLFAIHALIAVGSGTPITPRMPTVVPV
jgi:hypothetical protein